MISSLLLALVSASFGAAAPGSPPASLIATTTPYSAAPTEPCALVGSVSATFVAAIPGLCSFGPGKRYIRPPRRGSPCVVRYHITMAQQPTTFFTPFPSPGATAADLDYRWNAPKGRNDQAACLQCGYRQYNAYTYTNQRPSQNYLARAVRSANRNGDNTISVVRRKYFDSTIAEAFSDVTVSGYSDRSSLPRQPFEDENILLVSDDICDSVSAVFPST
ncbi:hypothetical protein K461DRAFT_303733 [Myriangium duriaei CBS 260.36]|uniref:Uncharacterized protein n=1 Tax=Myriangium duriaei CBS 260.36 TaxID=1168546 RepID=A0A9P4J978_9PEZI|nr:hypothetical protein K461DRAFT_303733 [Myriangium duriaei CBS 260.36]